MHKQGRCHACGKFNEFPLTDCKCSKSDLEKFHSDTKKYFDNLHNNSEPSIEQCKSILMANGYIVKKNPKRKKKKR